MGETQGLGGGGKNNRSWVPGWEATGPRASVGQKATQVKGSRPYNCLPTRGGGSFATGGVDPKAIVWFRPAMEPRDSRPARKSVRTTLEQPRKCADEIHRKNSE